MPTPEVAAVVIAKIAGAFIGALLALVVIPPRSLREFASRSVVSVICGFVFAPTVAYYLHLPAGEDYTLPAATLAGVAAWWVLGAVVSFARKWKPKGPGEAG